MSKIEDAKEILIALGLPKKQQNDRSARTLLALANIKKHSSWKDATNHPKIIHEIIEYISKNYDFEYAENSRETIRRQTIHQFEQGGIVLRNADDPSRPTNSPLTNYSLTKEVLKVIKAFNSKRWEEEVSNFLENVGMLSDKYNKRRKAHRIPIVIRDKEFKLSPGKHNKLQKSIYDKFGPIFAPGSILLYMGDTAKKHLWIDTKYLEKLNIDITSHDKLPDVVLYYKEKNWLYLIEAVTSHGPVTPKRRIEIEKMLENTNVKRIYVSAFLDFKTFLEHAKDIAWETEIWIAERPNHMIHYNGDKFLKPSEE